MLTECLVAAALVLAPVGEDDPGRGPCAGEGAVAPAVATETTVLVTPLGGGEVRVDVRVTGADGSLPGGRVLLHDGAAALADLPLTHGRASLTTGAVADGRSLTATYQGDRAHLSSGSASGSPPGPLAGAVTGSDPVSSPGSVSLTIPAGALTITLAPGRADTLRVSDTRAGERGFTVSAALVPAGAGRSRVLPVVVTPVQIPGYALQADDARVRAPVLLLSRRSTTVLTYPAQHSLGALDVEWHVVGPAPARLGAIVWTVL